MLKRQSLDFSLLGLTLGLGLAIFDFTQMDRGIWKLNGVTTPSILHGMFMFHATTTVSVQEWPGIDSDHSKGQSQSLKRLLLAFEGQNSKKELYHVDQHEKLKG